MTRRSDNKGFTLVEVLISITILAVISIPLMKYFADSLRYSNLTERRQRATLLAQETLESLKNQNTLITRIANESEPGVTLYGVPYMDDYTVTDESAFNSGTGTGEIVLTKSVTSGTMNYKVEVKLSTLDESVKYANATQRASVYGIDDTETMMVVEQSEEMDALWHLLQVNNGYKLNNNGLVFDASPAADASTAPAASPLASPAASPGSDVELLTDINSVRDILQREIFIDIGKETLDPFYYTVTVHYEYFCKKKISGKDIGEERYVTNNLVNDRMQDLKSVYLLFNIVDPDTDKVYINWASGAMPTLASDIPEIFLVCQNLDALGAAVDAGAPTPAPGELAPKLFPSNDKYKLFIKLQGGLDAHVPTIRTNLVNSSDASQSKGVISCDAGAYPTAKLGSLTQMEAAGKVMIAMEVNVYSGSDTTPLVSMKSTKGE